jgi:hypothetical protein
LLESAVEALENRIDKLPHPEVGLIRLVNFSHESPGLRTLRRQICEALVMVLEEQHEITARA